MKKVLGLFLLIFLGLQISFAQALSEKDKERNDLVTAKKYYAEHDKCRKLISEKKYDEAETSCRLVVSIAENLPRTRYMEKHSAYETLGVAFLRQHKSGEAIKYFDKSLEVGKTHLDDTDSETGEVYFLIGQANHLLEKVGIAKDFYTKAENAYRAAFKKIDAEELREYYPKPIINILETHLILLENAGLKDEAAKIEKRLAETKVEFAKYLEK